MLLSLLAEERLKAGASADLGLLLGELVTPPINTIGALPLDSFMPKKDRKELAAALNTLLASPTFASWRTGASLDLDACLRPATPGGKTPSVIVCVAHLDDEERTLVLGVLLEEILSWVPSLPGTQRLRALIVFDEVYGFIPPHPATPTDEAPARPAHEAGACLRRRRRHRDAEPIDLDYRALGNAGVWCIGRLQTDADCARVIDGLASSDRAAGDSAKALAAIVKRLNPRWFVFP